MMMDGWKREMTETIDGVADLMPHQLVNEWETDMIRQDEVGLGTK